MSEPKFTQISDCFFANSDYAQALAAVGLDSIDAVFAFEQAESLVKPNLASWRSRLKFHLESPNVTVYLKRYDNPPASVQLKNWMTLRRRSSCAMAECDPTLALAAAGVSTPEVVAYGCQWGSLFEKRSFIISRQIPDADALERRLPAVFTEPPNADSLRRRREFIAKLAGFVADFHRTGYRHRDLYLAHIFYADDGSLALIDLARAFKPSLLAERFRVKDIAQLHYSAPAAVFSATDRLRFYLAYSSRDALTASDKAFIGKVTRKADLMARHDIKHNRPVPFLAGSTGGQAAP